MSKWWKGALHKICAALMTFTKISDLNQLCMGGPCYSHHRKLWWWNKINNKHLKMFGGFFYGVCEVLKWKQNLLVLQPLGQGTIYWMRKEQTYIGYQQILEYVKKEKTPKTERGSFNNIKQQWWKITELEAFWNNKELKAVILRGIMTKNLRNPNFFFGKYSQMKSFLP